MIRKALKITCTISLTIAVLAGCGTVRTDNVNNQDGGFNQLRTVGNEREQNPYGFRTNSLNTEQFRRGGTPEQNEQLQKIANFHTGGAGMREHRVVQDATGLTVTDIGMNNTSEPITNYSESLEKIAQFHTGGAGMREHRVVQDATGGTVTNIGRNNGTGTTTNTNNR